MRPSTLSRLLLLFVLVLSATGWQQVEANPINAEVITQLSPTAVRPERHEKRVIGRGICSTVSFTTTLQVKLLGLLTVPLNFQTYNQCLCATSDRALTETSQQALRGTLLGLLATVGTALNLEALLSNNIYPAAIAALDAPTVTTQCVYPAFAIPNSCTACSYTCRTGYQLCNRQCIPVGQPCVSPGVFKRSLATRSKFICPLDEVPCPASRGTTKVASIFDLKNVECVDIMRKLESCGGCLTPFKNQPQGQDCTQIPHAVDVSCVGGGCVVESCERGFLPNYPDRTACNPLPLYSSAGQAGATRTALTRRGQRVFAASRTPILDTTTLTAAS